MLRTHQHIPTDSPTSGETPDPRCPACGYDLRGLPADHRCPECGYGYQRSALAVLIANDAAYLRMRSIDALWLAGFGGAIAAALLLAVLAYGGSLDEAVALLVPVCFAGAFREFILLRVKAVNQLGGPLVRLQIWLFACPLMIAWPALPVLLAALVVLAAAVILVAARPTAPAFFTAADAATVRSIRRLRRAAWATTATAGLLVAILWFS